MKSAIITLSILASISAIVAIVFAIIYHFQKKKLNDNADTDDADKQAEKTEKSKKTKKSKKSKKSDDASEDSVLETARAAVTAAEGAQAAAGGAKTAADAAKTAAEGAQRDAKDAKTAAENAQKAADAAKSAVEAQAEMFANDKARRDEIDAKVEIEDIVSIVDDIAGSVEHWVGSTRVLKNDIDDVNDPANGLFARRVELTSKYRRAKAKVKITSENARNASMAVTNATANAAPAEEIDELNEQKKAAVEAAKNAESTRQSLSNALVALKHSADSDAVTFEKVLTELKGFNATGLEKDRTTLMNRLNAVSKRQQDLASKLPKSETVKTAGDKISYLISALNNVDLDGLKNELGSLNEQIISAIAEIDALLASNV